MKHFNLKICILDGQSVVLTSYLVSIKPFNAADNAWTKEVTVTAKEFGVPAYGNFNILIKVKFLQVLTFASHPYAILVHVDKLF